MYDDMTKTVIVFATITLLVIGAGMVWGDVPSRSLYDAIRQVESAGNNKAVGKDGELGPYQCGRAAWTDACEYEGLDWDYDTHVWDPDRCEYIMYLYWLRHKATTNEQRARIWNGGPRGMSKPSTLAYWRKVQEAMKENNNG